MQRFANSAGNPPVGPVGATLRLVAGLALVALAVVEYNPRDGFAWGLETRDVVLGLAVLPGLMLGGVLLARRHADRPLRLTGPVGLAITCVVIVALFTIPATTGAAALFFGGTLLLAAARRQPGCEATVLTNALLRRDDQIGCPVFTSIDQAESCLRHRASTVDPSTSGREPDNTHVPHASER
jgi:hypothetical protein